MCIKNVFISCFFLFLSVQVYSQSDHKEMDMSPHPVRALYLSSIEAFNAGNLDLFLSNFSSDIKMYGTDGMYVGKDALRERFEAIFKQFPNKKMEIPELSLELLSDEIVLVHFTWTLYPMGQGPSYRGLGSGIYVVKGDRWVEILETETVTEVDEALKQR